MPWRPCARIVGSSRRSSKRSRCSASHSSGRRLRPQPASRERGGIGRVVRALVLRSAHRRKLTQELRSSAGDRRLQLRVIVLGEEEKRRGGRELLPLKEHRRARTQEERAVSARIRPGCAHSCEPPAAAGVRHLIVTLQVRDEPPWLDAARRRAAARLLPGVNLALEQVAVLRGRHELLGRAPVVAEVRLGACPSARRTRRGACRRSRPRRARVHLPSRSARRSDETRVLRLVLGDDDGAPTAGRTRGRAGLSPPASGARIRRGWRPSRRAAGRRSGIRRSSRRRSRGRTPGPRGCPDRRS